MLRIILSLTSIGATVGSAYLLARGNLGLSPEVIAELSATKYDYNPDLLAALSGQAADTWTGVRPSAVRSRSTDRFSCGSHTGLRSSTFTQTARGRSFSRRVRGPFRRSALDSQQLGRAGKAASSGDS